MLHSISTDSFGLMSEFYFMFVRNRYKNDTCIHTVHIIIVICNSFVFLELPEMFTCIIVSGLIYYQLYELWRYQMFYEYGQFRLILKDITFYV